jgi:hypothetical protein
MANLDEFVVSVRENGAELDGLTNDTTALTTTLAQVAPTGTAPRKRVLIDGALFIGNPLLVDVAAGVTIFFVGNGALTWRFERLRDVKVRRRGSFAATPSVSIAPANGASLTVTYRLKSATVVQPGTGGYMRGQDLTVVGGTGTSGEVNVRSTRVVFAGRTVAGSGYPASSTVEFAVAGGVGRRAIITGKTNASGQVMSGTANIIVVNGGSYTTNPVLADVALEKTNPLVPGSGFRVNLQMGVETIAVSSAQQGSYTDVPTGERGTTGSGSGATVTATFEIATAAIVPGAEGAGFLTPPAVTVGMGGELQPIGIRPTINGTFVGDLASPLTGSYREVIGQPRSARLRRLYDADLAGYAADRKLAALPSRDLDERLREVVSVRDFGAVGDGRERGVDEHPLWPAIMADPAAYGFVTASPESADKLKLIEPSDTLDWLAFELAIRFLADPTRGGGVLLVPPGHYVTRRHVNLLDGVEIRGESRRTTLIDNIWEAGIAYEEDFRPMVLAIGAFHPRALESDDPDRLELYDVAAPVAPGSVRVRLATTAEAAEFPVGGFAMLGTIAAASSTGDEHPKFAQINRVRAVEGAELVFERPFKRAYDDPGTAKASLRRFGTGLDQDAGLGATPWLLRRDVTIRSLSTRGRTLIARNAAWNLLVEDVDHRGRSGLSHNAFVHSTLRRVSITTELRGIETKGESFDTTFEDIAIVFESAVKREALPLVAVAESSDGITYRRMTVQDGPGFGQGPQDTEAQVPRVRCAAYDTVLDNVTVVTRVAGNAHVELTTEQGGESTVIRRLRLHSAAAPAAATRWLSVRRAKTDHDRHLLQADGLVCTGTVVADDEALNIVAVAEGSYVRGLELPAGDKVGNAEARSLAVQSGERVVSKALLRLQLSEVNLTSAVGARLMLDNGLTVFRAPDTNPPEPAGRFEAWFSVPPVDNDATKAVVAIRPGTSRATAGLRWTQVGSRDEYFVELKNGGNPSLPRPLYVIAGDASLLSQATGYPSTPLPAGTWSYAEPPVTNSFVTLVVSLPGTFSIRDPDENGPDFIRVGPNAP